ncbi:hypothetical protein F4861DRAFT_490087 [Xylaria intraflava]|nr:hypothetical protein F4861DRAFT_490087 [Xylaria intraflava]
MATMDCVQKLFEAFPKPGVENVHNFDFDTILLDFMEAPPSEDPDYEALRDIAR